MSAESIFRDRIAELSGRSRLTEDQEVALRVAATSLFSAGTGDEFADALVLLAEAWPAAAAPAAPAERADR